MLKPIVQITVFLLEIVMLIAFGWYGYSQPATPIARIGLAISLVGLTAIIWALWAAPASKRRLSQPALVLFRGSLFLLASCCLFYLREEVWAIVMAALAISTQIGCYYMKM